MARTIEHKKIESPTARARLKRGRQTHFQSLVAGKAALGYTRKDDAPHGRWFLRRYIGGDKYSIVPLGAADDEKGVQADGATVLDFEQAKTKALEVLAQSNKTILKGGALTVRRAFAAYVIHLNRQGKNTLDTERRGAALIMPELGDIKVVDLTTEQIRTWLTEMAARPARLRSKPEGKKNTNAPSDESETGGTDSGTQIFDGTVPITIDSSLYNTPIEILLSASGFDQVEYGGTAGGTNFTAFSDPTLSFDSSDPDYSADLQDFSLLESANLPAAVPEPLSLSLFGAGLFGAVALRRRRAVKRAL